MLIHYIFGIGDFFIGCQIDAIRNVIILDINTEDKAPLINASMFDPEPEMLLNSDHKLDNNRSPRPDNCAVLVGFVCDIGGKRTIQDPCRK